MTVDQISKEFIAEAVNSPHLLEDMAAMEKYMAESYGGRVFIELLQNADDANSKNIKICEFNGNLIFANNGRPFDENDVISICRSGVSSKKRGTHIGYRGIGFKSTTYLTSEILIYTANTFFTFSKELCSKKLNKEKDKVPTVRIPFKVDDNEIDLELLGFLRSLSNEGFETIFIFENANLGEFIDEVKEINYGYFIFLRNVEDCEINIKGYSSHYVIKREALEGYSVISTAKSNNDQWLIVENTTTKIAFKFQNRVIVPCKEEDALYYCFLPTFDKVIFPIKVNGDFSTDPSRKHLITDEITVDTISYIASDLCDRVFSVLNGKANSVWSNLLQILSQKNAFSKANTILSDALKKKLESSPRMVLNDGRKHAISTYRLFPDWLEVSEQIYIRKNSSYVNKQSIDVAVYDSCPVVDEFIKQFSNEKYSLTDFVEIMSDRGFVRELNHETKGKIIGNIIKSARTQSVLGEHLPVENIILQNNERIFTLSDVIRGKEKELDPNTKKTINQYANQGDIAWFCDTHSIEKSTLLLEIPKSPDMVGSGSVSSTIYTKPVISKWRSAEQQCLELETSLGNKPVDVSKQNLGYDIVSKTPTGTARYIEVKSLATKGASISMTNNEYTAAHQFGDNYFLCLVIQSETSFNAIYIQNPLKNLQLEKRVKMWEWYCDNYSGEEIVVKF